MTGSEVTAAIERAGEAVKETVCTAWPAYVSDRMAVRIARDGLAAALDVPQMAAAIVDHLGTDTLSGDSETLVCGGCGHVLVTGDPDDDRDPQAEHATHHATLIRAALIGEDS